MNYIICQKIKIVIFNIFIEELKSYEENLNYENEEYQKLYSKTREMEQDVQRVSIAKV